MTLVHPTALHAHQAYQGGGHAGNYSESVNHYYHRGALLFWPEGNDTTIRLSRGGVSAVKEYLSDAVEVHLEERSQDSLLELQIAIRRAPKTIEVTDSFCQASVALHDAALFRRFVKVSPAASLHVSDATWVEAIRILGFLAIKDVLDDALAQDASTKAVDRCYRPVDDVLAHFTDANPDLAAWGHHQKAKGARDPLIRCMALSASKQRWRKLRSLPRMPRGLFLWCLMTL